MNNVRLRDFHPETLLRVSNLIDKRISEIRVTPYIGRTHEQDMELDELLQFQTQALYARELVKSENKVSQS